MTQIGAESRVFPAFSLPEKAERLAGGGKSKSELPPFPTEDFAVDRRNGRYQKN
ncbi:MAG: hypothetical protein L0215_21600 [Gemmataceae bacterium]|nr:hypothetical protein [Gemmataceae bacterium]